MKRLAKGTEENARDLAEDYARDLRQKWLDENETVGDDLDGFKDTYSKNDENGQLSILYAELEGKRFEVVLKVYDTGDEGIEVSSREIVIDAEGNDITGFVEHFVFDEYFDFEIEEYIDNFEDFESYIEEYYLNEDGEFDSEGLWALYNDHIRAYDSYPKDFMDMYAASGWDCLTDYITEDIFSNYGEYTIESWNETFDKDSIINDDEEQWDKIMNSTRIEQFLQIDDEIFLVRFKQF